MKNILFTIFAAAITFASCSDNAENNPVKEITQKITKEEKVDIISNESGEQLYKRSKVALYTYHKNGYVSSITRDKKSKSVFRYNSDKQLTEKLRYEYDSEKKAISAIASRSYKYFYNKEGLITSVKISNPYTEEITAFCEYNDKNLLVTQIIKYASSGNDEFYYEYDSNKNCVKYTKGKSENADYTTYTSDTKKNPSSVIFPKAYCLINPTEHGPHNFESISNYSINEQGEKTTDKTPIKYEYNKAGYPTKSVRKDSNENSKVQETRTTLFTYEQEKNPNNSKES